MPTGTDAGLLDSPRPQSVYKHGILGQYVVRFATMKASKLNPKRCVLFDGFAGRGRFDTGQAGSAEHMMIAAQKVKATTQIDLLLVKQAAKDHASLELVAPEYRARGIRIDSHNDDCGNRPAEMPQLAAGASLFVFLIPVEPSSPCATRNSRHRTAAVAVAQPPPHPLVLPHRVRAHLGQTVHASVSDSAACHALLDYYTAEGAVLEARRRRVRNALVHGNPASFAIVESVREYARLLSGTALSLALEAYAEGEEPAAALARRTEEAIAMQASQDAASYWEARLTAKAASSTGS